MSVTLPPLHLSPHQWTEYHTGCPEDSDALQKKDRVFFDAWCDHNDFGRTREGTGLWVGEHAPDGVESNREEVNEKEERARRDPVQKKHKSGVKWYLGDMRAR